MAPPSLDFLVSDKSTYGDVSQRDIFIRQKYQTTKDADTFNYFYYTDGISTTNTIAESASLSTSTEGLYNIFTKPSGSTLSTSSTATITIGPSTSYFRSPLNVITGIASVNSSFSVLGTSSLSGAATLGSNLSVTGISTLTGAVTLGSSLSAIVGPSTFKSIDVNESVTVGTNLTVSGVSSTGSFYCVGTSNIRGGVTLGSTLAVTGPATVSDTFNVGGAATLDSSLAVTGISTLTGAVTLGGSLTAISGASTLKSVDVNESVTVGTNLTVSGVTSTGSFYCVGTSNIRGEVTLGSSLSVTGLATVTETFYAGGAATLNSSLQVNGITTVSNAFRATGVATLGSTLDVSGNTHLLSDLTVDGDTYLNGGMTLDGDLGMGGHNITSVANVYNGTAKWTFDSATPKLQATVGNVDVVGITSTGMTINGNLNVVGTTYQTTIESNTVQVGDLNLNLGYLGTSLDDLDGGGITLGDLTASITHPTISFDKSSTYWKSNIDFRTVGTNSYAALTTSGTLAVVNSSSSTEKVTIGTKSINFSSKWRFYENDETMELQYSSDNGDTWVPKFQFVGTTSS